ncbi:MAG: ACP S-malonyltransferase [Candidatus Dormibacteria bacterium]|jgi:[acyl-carrier-protein] S-malonyltransferase
MLDQVALVFPGQGSQVPGMGGPLVEAGLGLELLDIAERSGIDLRRLVVEGDAARLRATEVAQPALFYTGIALSRVLLEGGFEPAAAAGHSLGEYCAVVAAGALSADDGMRLVLERGRLMASAPQGTMAAVLGLEWDQLARLCQEASRGGECCVVANDNSPGQLVVSGSHTGISRVGELAKAAGARKVVPLNVGGAFHSPLMADSARTFALLLDEVEILDPRFPVGAGVGGRLSHSAAEIRAGLRAQLEGPVGWTGMIRSIGALGVRTFMECGPGSTLAGLIRRILPEARTISVDCPESAVKALSEVAAAGGQAAAERDA